VWTEQYLDAVRVLRGSVGCAAAGTACCALRFAPRSSRELLAGAAEARLEAEHTESCESPGNFRRVRPIYYKGRSKRGNPILSGILPYAQHRAS